MSVDNSRQGILKRFREQIARGEPIIGGGAGTGLSAVSEEAGGIDLLIVYNSGRYRMAGRGSSAGLLAYGNANQIVKEMAYEVLPVVKKTPVLAGVNGTDPFMIPHLFLEELRALGFAGIQNFPTVGLFDGDMRQAFEETGMSYQLEVDVDPPRAPDGDADDALRLQPAGGRAHGRRGGGPHRRPHGRHDRRVDRGEELEDAGRLRGADSGHRRRGSRREPGGPRHLPRRPDLGAARRGVHHHYVSRRRRLLRRELGRAPSGRARDRRSNQDVQAHPQGRGPMKTNQPLRFVTTAKARVEFAPWGKHWWLSQPDVTGTELLTLVRVTMRAGAGHQFHYHPELEEIIYVVDGVAEQWVDREKRSLKAGDIAFIPKNVVHAIHNPTKKPMTFLAILSPAESKGPFLVDCYEDEPWRSLRKPFVYPEVDPRTGRPKPPRSRAPGRR